MEKLLALTIPGPDGDPIELVVPEGVPSGGLSGDGGGNEIVGIAFQLLFIAAIILALFFIVWGGIQWITSSGDKQKVASARSRIIYAIAGLIIAFLAILFVNTLAGFFGAPKIGTTGTQAPGTPGGGGSQPGDPTPDPNGPPPGHCGHINQVRCDIPQDWHDACVFTPYCVNRNARCQRPAFPIFWVCPD